MTAPRAEGFTGLEALVRASANCPTKLCEDYVFLLHKKALFDFLHNSVSQSRHVFFCIMSSPENAWKPADCAGTWFGLPSWLFAFV